ncbi:MAG: hypothetical protein U0992_02980 [Planctomycetaceae bacterium]
MGTTLAWSVKQSAGVVFLIWGVMGFGMASPYLLLGAFPQLVNWLPRPGMWMVRFKEFAGFVLMGAVIWLISSLHANLLKDSNAGDSRRDRTRIVDGGQPVRHGVHGRAQVASCVSLVGPRGRIRLEAAVPQHISNGRRRSRQRWLACAP